MTSERFIALKNTEKTYIFALLGYLPSVASAEAYPHGYVTASSRSLLSTT